MKTVTLGEVAEIVSGGTPKSGVDEYWNGDVLWATPTDLSRLDGAYIGNTPRRLTKAGLASCAATVLPTGSVLLSSRAPIGHVAINTEPMATNQGFKSLVPRFDRLDAKYLYHWLRSRTDYLQSLGNGATFKEISKTTVYRIQIPVPHIDEQRRIAAILDQADTLRALRRQVLTHLDALSQSIFHDMFGGPVATRWAQVRLGELGEWRSGGTPPRAESGYFNGDIPWFSSGELGPLYVSESIEHITRRATTETPAKEIPAGSLLIGMYDTAALKSSITTVPSTCNQAIAFARLDTSLADTVFAYFAVQATRNRVLALRRGIRQKNLNLSMVRQIAVPQAPLTHQREFAARVEQINAQRHSAQQALGVGGELYASLQSRAFRGEL